MVITLQQLIIIYNNDYCINTLWIAYQPEELPSLSLELMGKTKQYSNNL